MNSRFLAHKCLVSVHLGSISLLSWPQFILVGKATHLEKETDTKGFVGNTHKTKDRAYQQSSQSGSDRWKVERDLLNGLTRKKHTQKAEGVATLQNHNFHNPTPHDYPLSKKHYQTIKAPLWKAPSSPFSSGLNGHSWAFWWHLCGVPWEAAFDLVWCPQLRRLRIGGLTTHHSPHG